MVWILWVIIALFVWSVLLVVSSVGKPRQPITPAVATITVVLYGGVIAALVAATFQLS